MLCGNCSHLFYVQKCNEHGKTGSNLNINSNLQLKVWLVIIELRLKNCMNQENEYLCTSFHEIILQVVKVINLKL